MTTSHFTIEQLDPRDPATQDAVFPVTAESVRHDMIGHPPATRDFLRVLFGGRAHQKATVFTAREADGTVAGYARIVRGTIENRTLSWGGMWVRPGARRRGAGSALLPALTGWAAAEGCDRLVLDGPRTEGGPPFAARHGGRIVGTDRRSALALRDLDRGRFEQWAAASAGNSGYRLVPWVDQVPDELVESFVQAENAMHDAPHGELELEIKQSTVEEHREREAASMNLGMTVHGLAAVAPDDSIAGYTTLYVYPGKFALADIGSTAVVGTHRGHGLGLRLKAEQTLFAVDRLPHLDVISTWNNEDNAPMLRINELMGYQAAETWHGYQFEL